ncbi:serine-type D-Ala-D-Ala carboxypeptidase [Streptococcus pneumoniae]|nr:serine-type D-Ala-D-Ala carboxypeptidase [Streptococcus pneumoniae]CWB32522.1 serine-type D-Ala-D-Ala carboxypeptidase [Streptococcus pneumoniae]
MRKSFYTWLMTERNPKSNSPKAILADLAFEEAAFPKHTDDFDEVSRFLEEHASFSFNLGDFDSIWQEYPKFQVEVSHPKEIHLATCSPSIF